MTEIIKEEQLLDIIEERKEGELPTVIHIYDYNKMERIFNVDIERYNGEKTEYFDMTLEGENPGKKICEDLQEHYRNQIKISSYRDCIYGELSVEFKIGRVRVMIAYYSKEGYEYLKEIYNKQHPNKTQK